MIKKILLVVLALGVLFLGNLYADRVYEIETSYGTEKVVVPEGYSDLDVLLEVSKAYYEQNKDLEEVQETLESLKKTSEDYVTEISNLKVKYEDLIGDYEVLVKRLEIKNSLDAVKGIIGVNYSPYKGQLGLGVSVGALLFNRITATLSASYFSYDSSLGVSLGIGVLF